MSTGVDADPVAERIRDFVLAHGDWPGPRSELTDTVPLLNNVLDSIGVIELVTLLESDFGIAVDDDDLDPENFATIRAVVGFIERKR